MRLLICAGGTGGGVYPALAVLQALKAEDELRSGSATDDPMQVLWVGGFGGMEAGLVKRAGVPFDAIPAAGLHGVGLRALPGNLLTLGRGYRTAQAILRRFQPDVLFFTGGFVAAPLAVAGRKLPTLVYVPDIEPGLALKYLAYFADCITITTAESGQFFTRGQQKKLEVSGYPTRPDLKAWDLTEARQALGLSADLPVLLVYGGSKGARSINRALLGVLPKLLAEMQIVHISGQLDWEEVEAVQAGLPAGLAPRYRAYPYLHAEMGAALTTADLVVSRAGASSLGEYPLFGLAAVLAPYPHAWRYQRVNAEYLSQRGAAVILDDADLAERLLPVVRSLLGDRIRLEGMRQAMRALSRPEAARTIARRLMDLASETSGKRV